MRLDDIPFAPQTDYIRLTAITYQSFGLDKKRDTQSSISFFGSLVQKRTVRKPRILLKTMILDQNITIKKNSQQQTQSICRYSIPRNLNRAYILKIYLIN